MFNIQYSMIKKSICSSGGVKQNIFYFVHWENRLHDYILLNTPCYMHLVLKTYFIITQIFKIEQ